MMVRQKRVTAEVIGKYREYLWREEKARGTIEKYLRDIRAFETWLSAGVVTKEQVVRWKEHLLKQGYVPGTINSMLSAVNGFFSFMGWEDCRVKVLKVQRRMFRDETKD